MNKVAQVIFPISLILLLSSPLGADPIETAPTSVVMYKSGLTFVVEEGRGKADSEWIQAWVHSMPLLGTLQVAAKGSGELLEMKGEPSTAFGPRQGPLDPLMGKTVFVTTPLFNLAGLLRGAVRIEGSEQEYVALEAADGTSLVPVSQIVRIDTAETLLFEDGTQPDGAHELQLKLSKEGGTVHIALSYMTRGLGWSPSYVIDMTSENEALLSMSAEVINEAFDMASAQVHFATGEAAFPLGYLSSPLFDAGLLSEDVIRAVMSSVDFHQRAPVDNFISNAMPVQAQSFGGYDTGVDAASLQSAEETHLYGPVELTLKKGERAVIPLGAKTVPAELVYYWEVPAMPGYGEESNKAWLALKLKNEMPFPLTTGQILVSKAGRPLGQGILTYTHEKREALVPFSLGSGVICGAQEEEEDRDAVSGLLRGRRYEKVMVKGSLTVANTREKRVSIHVEKTLNGHISKSSHKGKTREQLGSPYDPNPVSKIEWELGVDGGETLEISYEYYAYVPSGSSW